MRYTRLAGLLAGLLLPAACTSSTVPGSASQPPPHRAPTPTTRPAPTRETPTPSRSSPSGPARSPSPSPSSVPAPDGTSRAERVFASMSEAQRVGQLLMVDCSTSGVSPATATAISRYHVGSVILDGTSEAGVTAMRGLTARVQGLAPPGVGLFVATDQEGGLVQRLRGTGFTDIISARQQGTIAPTTLQGFAQGWGQQLRAAGVNVNLAPVFDTVPAGFGSNPPIGDLDRQFGSTPATVTAHGMAVVRGMTAAGVDVTVKHFPGLGRVHGNTDTSNDVTDYVTTRDDPYLRPFRAAARAGVPFVMVSTAMYSRIDPGVPAAFSRPIVSGMLRDDLGYRGVIISDDIGVARQVAGVPVGQRAVRFVAAGGDIVLTVDAAQAAAMTRALLARAQRDPAFRKTVNAAALLVLQAKQARGLL